MKKYTVPPKLEKTMKRDLLKLIEKGDKEIDENPFIRHKLGWVERMCGATMSQADRYKLLLREIVYGQVHSSQKTR